MELNYVIVGLVALAIITGLLWFIRRNRRDRKDLERKLNRQDMDPERHKPEE